MSLISSIITKIRGAIGATAQAVAHTTLGGKLLGYADVRVKFTDTGFQGYSKRVYDLANKGVIFDRREPARDRRSRRADDAGTVARDHHGRH